jgi:hypothetical protein
MPNHLGIILAAATTLISAVPAFAFGSSHSSSSHSSSATVNRAGTAMRSVGVTSARLSPSTRFQSQAPPTRFSSTTTAKMLVLTAPGALTKTTARPKTSTAADPPAADPPAADPPAPSAATVATSPGTLGGGQGSSANLSQFNTGALDVATPAVSPSLTTDITSVTLPSPGANLESAIPAVSGLKTGASTSTTTVAASIISAENLLLLNTATSGAVPQAPVTAAIAPPTAAIVESGGEVIATSGGSSITGGATGRDMPECMAAWDKATHITKPKWREVCARTLTNEHTY